jgi:predicted hydrocarbon binding protein
MVWDKKTSYCIQNIFFEKGVKFFYARMLLDNISDSADVFPILQGMNATIKYGIFARIEEDKTKWSFTFTAADKIDEKAFIEKFIEKLGQTRVNPATKWEQDIIYLGDGYAYSPEYPIVGYPTLDPPNPALPIILIGGMWKRIILSMDDQFTSEGTDIVLYNAGKAQGSVMGERLGKRFNIPKDVRDVNFGSNVKKLFSGYGHCDIKNIEVDEGKNRVRQLLVFHSFFNYLGFPEDRKNHFLIGLFDGFFSTHLGTEHEFDETECEREEKINCIYENTAS